MSNVASERVVNGIKTRVLHGKDYVEVHERVRLIQHDEKAEGYSMVKQERYEWNGRHFLSITIEVKGKQYIGDAEVTFAAPKNTPAGSSPLETAQTSALGRALAFAGYGTVESIASFDEIARTQPGTIVVESAPASMIEAPTGGKDQALHALSQPGSYEQHQANGNQVPTIRELQARCNQVVGRGQWQTMIQKALKVPADAEITLQDDDLTPEDRQKIAGYLTFAEHAKKASAGAGR